MARYLLVESKDPSEGGEYAFDLGKQLRELHHDVTIYLVQDAVLAGRRRFEGGKKLLDDATRERISVLADETSLRQRGLIDGRLSPSVRVSNMGELIDLLMEKSDKAIWH